MFREDLARLPSANAPANMAFIRHAALNLLCRAKPITSFKNRRKRAGWNIGYLEAVIRGAAWAFKRSACRNRRGTCWRRFESL